MYIFGTGALIATPTRDNTGALIATPTPVRLGVLQDVGIDMKVDLKKLHGEKKFAVAVGQGKGEISIKAKYANINMAAVALFTGSVVAAGVKGLTQTTGVIPATPFTLTASTMLGGGGLQFVADAGCYFATTGQQLTRVASAPVAGQYSLNTGTGVYTFAAADTGKTVVFDMEISRSGVGQTIELTNDNMGITPKFSIILLNKYDGESLVLKLNSCTSSTFGLPMKNEDFAASDFDAQAMADAAGNLGYISMFAAQ